MQMNKFQLEKSPVAHQIKEVIKGEILNQYYKPGQKISINEVAERLDCSIAPVREALSSLHNEKLLNFMPYRGYSIVPLLTKSEFMDLCDVRHTLELKAIELAINKVTNSDIEELKKLIEKGQLKTFNPLYEEYRAFTESDRKFHYKIFEIGGNSYLYDLWASLPIHLQVSRFYYQKGSQTDIDEGTVEHKMILNALGERDLEKSKKAMIHHLSGIFKRLAPDY